MAATEEILLLIHFFCLIAASQTSKHRLDGYHEDDGELWSEDITMQLIYLVEAHAAGESLIDIGRQITTGRDDPDPLIEQGLPKALELTAVFGKEPSRFEGGHDDMLLSDLVQAHPRSGHTGRFAGFQDDPVFILIDEMSQEELQLGVFSGSVDSFDSYQHRL